MSLYNVHGIYIYELKVQILIKVNAIKQFWDKDLDN